MNIKSFLNFNFSNLFSIAYEQAALKKRPAAITSQAENEKPVPLEYFCPLCKNIMKNAVLVPCCGESFCDNCKSPV